MHRREFLGLISFGGVAAGQNAVSLELLARSRRDGPVVERMLFWRAAETAIIVCDMWDNHYCKNSAKRVGEMAPRMNATIGMARERGVSIVHAPSGIMNFYKDEPGRKRMQAVKLVTPPVPIGKWCYLDPSVEGPLPIDDAKLPCDDAVVDPREVPISRQDEAIRIAAEDGISDDGSEIHSYFVSKGIRNVVMMGVHTNICVLGRPFGIRQQTRLGMNVVLARDLTDCMYDPRARPFVTHARGTELVVEHIERYWCPSILSGDLAGVKA